MTTDGSMGEAGVMTDLERLLDLQANDTAADQLRHRVEHLPERAELTRLHQVEADHRASLHDPERSSDALAREQKRLEDEIATIEAKVASVNGQLYGSAMTSPKEAQALQADLESLQRRQSTLEDEVIELMEQLEPVDERLAQIAASILVVEEECDRVAATLVENEAEVLAELHGVEQRREQLAGQVPEALLAEYERLRPLHAGVAVARLAGSTCSGCHLTLAAAEVDVLRRQPVDAIVHCPDCGVLLVR